MKKPTATELKELLEAVHAFVFEPPAKYPDTTQFTRLERAARKYFGYTENPFDPDDGGPDAA